MRVRRLKREILPDTHSDAGQHSDQQNNHTHAHHQRSDHSYFLTDFLGLDGD